MRRTWESQLSVRLLRSGAGIACAAAFLFAAAMIWGMAAPPPIMAVIVALVGLGILLLEARRQATIEVQIASLMDPIQPENASASQILSLVASQMQAVKHRIANVHPVTGLPTREHLLEHMTLDIDGGCGPTLFGAIRFCDFDRLAAFDQDAANGALTRFALRLTAATKPSHIIAQIDRDCFGVWFRGTDDLAASASEFRAIAYVAGQEIPQPDGPLSPTLEIGAAQYPRDAKDAAHLMLRLMAALSRADAFGVADLDFSPPSAEAAREQFMLEQDLGRAIAEDQLAMVFQPVVNLATRLIIGAEALVRWDHPILGMVSPARFIPIAEQIGLSDRIGLWVLNAACREARRWQDQGLAGLKVAVNLSAKQLGDPDLVAKVRRTLERHSLGAAALELELTETAAMADAHRTLHQFKALRAMGVSLAIDDFGSGYSSLSYLKNLPFDKLKIDREFVTNVDTRRDSQAICKALIELGRGLDLLVLAEGVETAAEVAALTRLGCSVFQGYAFSKPLKPQDFLSVASSPEDLLGGLRPTSTERHVPA